MEKLPYPILTDVLEVISAANESLDCGRVRQKALDLLFQTIDSEGAIFFLPDEQGNLTYIIIKNLDTDYCDYYRSYYYRFDPLQLTRGPGAQAGPRSPEQTFSYDTFQPTEYYNEFLKPQKIHHKLIVNLTAGRELYGRIVLTRPKKARRFSGREVRTAQTISPYLTHALAHNDLRRKIKLKGNILDCMEQQSSTGMILLDESLQIVYRNPKAQELFDKLKWVGPTDSRQNPISAQIMSDCQAIKEALEKDPVGGVIVPRHSIVQGPKRIRYALTSKILDPESDLEQSPLLVVSIEEQSPVNIDQQYLRDELHLSKREIDVVSLLVLGLTNAQIAKELFVSEVTIKKHLQSIYEKVGVNNRATLINRILTA